MYVIALPILCDNFNKEIETSSKSEINFDFVAIAAVFFNRVQNYFESTDADAILNDSIRNEKKNSAVQESFQSKQTFHLHLNWLNRKFCLKEKHP